jgi:integrase
MALRTSWREADPAARCTPFLRRLGAGGGVRLDIVSRQLGHASIAITADTYGHPDDKALEDAARKVADVLGEGAR